MISISLATASHSKAVAALIRRSFARQARIRGIVESEHPNYVAFDTHERVEQRIASGIVVFIVRAAAELVGTVSCVAGTDRRGEVMRLAVDPAHRGRNYGRTLM